MAEQEVPTIARAFINDHIESVMQLELLLLLASDAARRWTTAGLSAEMRVDAGWVEAQLAVMTAKGLLAAEPAEAAVGGPGTCRFAPRTEALGRGVAAVAAAYASRRVTVISLIFARPSESLRSFADAFRIRRDPPADTAPAPKHPPGMRGLTDG